MPEPKLNQHDYGTVVRRTIRDAETNELVDLSNATELYFRIEDPDGKALRWDALASPTSQFAMDHTIAPGELAFQGPFKLQPVVEFDANTKLTGDIETHKVKAALKEPAS